MFYSKERILYIMTKEIKISFYKLTHCLYYIVTYDHFCGSSLNLFSISSSFQICFLLSLNQLLSECSSHLALDLFFSGHI